MDNGGGPPVLLRPLQVADTLASHSDRQPRGLVAVWLRGLVARGIPPFCWSAVTLLVGEDDAVARSTGSHCDGQAIISSKSRPSARRSGPPDNVVEEYGYHSLLQLSLLHARLLRQVPVSAGWWYNNK